MLGIKRDKRVNSAKVNRLYCISWLDSGWHISTQARLYFEILLHVLQMCWLSSSPRTDSVSSTGQNRLPSVFIHILVWDRDSQAPAKWAQLWPQDPSRSNIPPVLKCDTEQSQQTYLNIGFIHFLIKDVQWCSLWFKLWFFFHFHIFHVFPFIPSLSIKYTR